jgi:hypothetical protein
VIQASTSILETISRIWVVAMALTAATHQQHPAPLGLSETSRQSLLAGLLVQSVALLVCARPQKSVEAICHPGLRLTVDLLMTVLAAAALFPQGTWGIRPSS